MCDNCYHKTISLKSTFLNIHYAKPEAPERILGAQKKQRAWDDKPKGRRKKAQLAQITNSMTDEQKWLLESYASPQLRAEDANTKSRANKSLIITPHELYD